MKECIKCKIEKENIDFHKNNRRSDGIQNQCKSCQSAYRKSRYLENKDYEDNRNKNYALKNKQRMLDNSRNWFKTNREKVVLDRKIKRNSNPLLKFKHNVRSLVYSSFRVTGAKKNSKTEAILGCSIGFFKTYIEKQFSKGMSWDKFGSDIHLDHYIPISSATTEEQVILLCHHTNLRPMWAKENIKKSNKIVEHQMKMAI